MNRILIFSLLASSNLYATEIEKCADRKIISISPMKAPRARELKEGSVSLSSLVGEDGKVKSTVILSQEGDLRWGQQAVEAMKKARFKLASKACEFEYVYTAKFDDNETEN